MNWADGIKQWAKRHKIITILLYLVILFLGFVFGILALVIVALSLVTFVTTLLSTPKTTVVLEYSYAKPDPFKSFKKHIRSQAKGILKMVRGS